jgi:presequence protease
MSLVNSDENKTFGVVLRTPVENSKGIPHILEHSVLCGSRKYPIKEPFVELMKVRQRGQLMLLSVKCVSNV